MNKPGSCILFLLIIFGNNLVLSNTKSEFHSDDTSYSFSVTIRSNLNCYDLSKLLFDQKTIRQLNPFADSIFISRIDSLSQIIEVHFKKWFYKGYSRYRRVINPGKSLTIDLMRFEHNWSAIPQLKNASIRYNFDSNGDDCTVRYYQKVTVNRKISFVYRKMIRLHLDNYTKALENIIKNAQDTRIQQ